MAVATGSAQAVSTSTLKAQGIKVVKWHFNTYIPYTGWYRICTPGVDDTSRTVDDWSLVTCKRCWKWRHKRREYYGMSL